MQPICPGLRGKRRKEVIRRHRRIVFEEVFNRYLEGKVDASKVHERARKLAEVSKRRRG